jgi:prophage regulatory protein
MLNDKLLKRKELYDYLKIKDTKLRELIKKGKIIKPIIIEGFNEELYSLNELQEFIETQKAKRKQNTTLVNTYE